MTTQEINSLLAPFVTPDSLSEAQLKSVSAYLELLLKWNSKMNLTSVREPAEIVTRHFGESFFAAQHIRAVANNVRSCIDVGSGAGFPGLPMKISAPELELTLIEANQKKVAFLRETIRALGISGSSVFNGRAEDFDKTADLVTLRAVEKFETVLPIAARKLNPNGLLCVLVGSSQVSQATTLLPMLAWNQPIPIPLSDQRVLLIGKRQF